MMKFLLAFGMMCLFSQQAGAIENFKLDKTDDMQVHETSYVAHGESCEMEWVVKRFPASSGIGISERSRCELELEQQADYRLALLKAAMRDTNNLQGMRNFYWGRLKRGDKNDVYSLRLRQAVVKSRNWNAETGTLVKYPKGVNHLVAEILNRENVFAEVASVFAKQGYTIKVNGVEKVLVDDGRAESTDLLLNGKLPIDCVVSFEVLVK